MQNFDLHMHTTYCDGKNTAEEMILSAIDKGLMTVGLSGHSFTWFDTSYCMSKEGTEQYISEVGSLAEKYADHIRVLTGIELDYYSDIDTEPFDYIIGSSHYILVEDDYIDVDYSPEMLMEGVNKHFGGDIITAAQAYYRQVGSMISKTNCDIIGHFDLVTKFNELGDDPLVNTQDQRYVATWKNAIDRIFEDAKKRYASGYINKLQQLGLIMAGDKPVFEINTGAIAKGYRSTPYPAQDQIDYIRSKGGILILSSDSHNIKTIAYMFKELEE